MSAAEAEATSATWDDATVVDRYVERSSTRGPRDQGERLLVELLPQAPRRVVDLGCGDGRLAARVLAARPGVESARLIDRPADDPEDRLAPVEDQLGWRRGAGLVEVDCLWRWRGFTLLVGEAP